MKKSSKKNKIGKGKYAEIIRYILSTGQRDLSVAKPRLVLPWKCRFV